jgi:hypothetical protein
MSKYFLYKYIPIAIEKFVFLAARKSSRVKDRKELSINLILGFLRFLNPEFWYVRNTNFYVIVSI